MFRADEWLRQVSDAVKWQRADAAMMEAMRDRAAGLGSSGGVSVSTSGVSDRMRIVDSLVDMEEARRRDESCSAVIEEALSVFDGMRAVGPLECEAANVMQLVHVSLETHGTAARLLGMAASTERRRYNYGVDWLDANGLAHAKAGIGSAS